MINPTRFIYAGPHLTAFGLFVGLAFGLVIPSTATAQESSNSSDLPLLYVSDVIEVPVRATGCSNCTIVHYGLSSGTAVYDLGEVEGDWTRIRSTGGSIEGWMLSRFLVQEPAARDQLVLAEADLLIATEENLVLSQQLDSLLDELRTMGLSVESMPSDDSENPNPVMRVSGDVVGLNNQNDELIRRNQFLQQEIDILTARNDRLEDSSWRSWFIYGAGAVLAGALLSILLPRLMPRKKYSEWG